MSLAYVRRPAPPDELRAVLEATPRDRPRAAARRGDPARPRLAVARARARTVDRRRSVGVRSRRARARRHDHPAARAGSARRAASRRPTSSVAEVLDTAGLPVPRGLGRRRLRQRGPPRHREPVGADRALNARVETPLAMALRGRFLVGSHPVDADFVRRFIASAARTASTSSGSTIRSTTCRTSERPPRRSPPRAPSSRRARLQLRADRRDRAAGRAGVAAARARRGARDPSRSDGIAPAAPRARARHAAARGERPAGRRLLPGLGRQRDRRRARGCARRRRPDRDRGLSGRADAAPRLGREPRRGARRLGLDTGSTCRSCGRRRTSSTSTSATSR